MAKLLYLSAFQRDHGSFVCMLCWHGSKAASLISPELSRSTHTSAEELIGIRQVSVKMETDQRFRQRGTAGMMLVLIMLAVLLANTVFYKEKKRLLTRYDADGRKEVICYIHHQDGQKH